MKVKTSSGKTLFQEDKELRKMNTLKTIALDTSANEILDFLKEESRRQAARDDEFLKIIGASVGQSYPTVT